MIGNRAGLHLPAGAGSVPGQTSERYEYIRLDGDGLRMGSVSRSAERLRREASNSREAARRCSGSGRAMSLRPVYTGPMMTRVRFAPSPTGLLHVGNVRTALFNWLVAKKQRGSFILRVEDTDRERSESRFEEQLIDDLRWLGLDWDEGIGKGGAFGPYRQTERFELYQRFARQLLAEGRAYYCFCTPEQLEADRRAQQAAGGPIHYSGRCRTVDPDEACRRVEGGEAATIRLRIRPGSVHQHDLVFGDIVVETSEIGDFVLLRSDGSAQYNFACVIDDALMRISHVIRGEGHLSNTPRQLLLYESLGWEPPAYAHLSTILGPDGTKLSKRHGATSIAEFREAGYLPEALLNYLSLLGWSPTEEKGEILTREQIIEDFDLGRVQLSPATFDFDKLNWVNRTHLRELSSQALLSLALPYLIDARVLPATAVSSAQSAWAERLLVLSANYVDKLSDLTRVIPEILGFAPDCDLKDPESAAILAQPTAVEVITAFRQALPTDDRPLTFDDYRDAVLGVKERTGIKGKLLFHPIRVAVTGRSSGPELDRLIPLIEEGSRLGLPFPLIGVRDRVDAAIRAIGKSCDE
jgi:nondiscriminating glutamyl-tRNA synthetase